MIDKFPTQKEKQEQTTKELDEETPWLRDNLFKPAKNVMVTAINAASNITNFFRTDTFGKLDYEIQNRVEILSPDWFAQNLAAASTAAVTYTIYGKFAGSTLRGLGQVFGAEGQAARVLSNKAFGLGTGAALLDGSRDVHEGESRLGNLSGSLAAFTMFGTLNPYLKELSYFSKGLGRFGIGASAGLTNIFIADSITQKQISNPFADTERASNAILAGGLLNIALPTVQEKLGKFIEKTESKLTGRVPLIDFITEHKLDRQFDSSGQAQVRSKALDLHSTDLPLTDIRPNNIYSTRNSIALDQQLMHRLNTAKGAELEKVRNEVASLIGYRLGGILATRHGYQSGVLDSTGMREALRDGRIFIKENGKELAPEKLEKLISANNLDLHLDGEFIVPPSGQKLVLDNKTPPKEILKTWERRKEYKDQITIPPNGSLLAMTREHLGLVQGPLPEWNGRLPIMAAINSKSSIARMFIETHQTAPQVNSGTDNRIVLEIKNNSGNELTLTKDMQIASLVFYTMTGHGENAVGSHFNGQKAITGQKETKFPTNKEDSPSGLRRAFGQAQMRNGFYFKEAEGIYGLPSPYKPVRNNLTYPEQENQAKDFQNEDYKKNQLALKIKLVETQKLLDDPIFKEKLKLLELDKELNKENNSK